MEGVVGSWACVTDVATMAVTSPGRGHEPVASMLNVRVRS
jgi:hypothetical protein